LLGLPGLRSSRPAAGEQRRLVDAYGRVAADLRLSLTDRCNLRCTYCMPAEGLDWMDRADLLDDDEIVRLVRIGTERLGITTVRLTGGEPLLRRGLEGLVARLAALDPAPVLALTTNGIGLAARAESLKAAGLDRINVSLDTLNPDTFAQLTRRRRHADVLDGIRAARAAGLTPVKINAVLMRGVNDHEAAAMLRWALDEDVQLRFIEQMPLDAQHGWRRSEMVTAAETLARLRAEFPLVVDPGHEAARGSAPAELFRVSGTEQSVGVIASVTQAFCGSCDRVRLTADGQIRTCLFAREESDLRLLLRGGADDATIAEAWVTAVAGKQPGHGIDDPTFLQPDRPMSAIGG
ncbi:MAG: GTP 3',8-cyclase MoaA, partial [Janthinobacterium lividum]